MVAEVAVWAPRDATFDTDVPALEIALVAAVPALAMLCSAGAGVAATVLVSGVTDWATEEVTVGLRCAVDEAV